MVNLMGWKITPKVMLSIGAATLSMIAAIGFGCVALYDNDIAHKSEIIETKKYYADVMLNNLNDSMSECNIAAAERDHIDILEKLGAPAAILADRHDEMMILLRNSLYGAYITSHPDPSTHRLSRWGSIKLPSVLVRLTEGYKVYGIKKTNNLHRDIGELSKSLRAEKDLKKLLFTIFLVINSLALIFLVWRECVNDDSIKKRLDEILAMQRNLSRNTNKK